MRVAIGAPANGAVLKDEIRAFLEGDERVTEVVDLSTPDVTYPQVSFQTARMVVDGTADRAVLVCGTGVGTAIAASKVRGARAATAHDLVTVRGAVENYDAQILCMGQNVVAPPTRGPWWTCGSTCGTTRPASTGRRSARSTSSSPVPDASLRQPVPGGRP